MRIEYDPTGDFRAQAVEVLKAACYEQPIMDDEAEHMGVLMHAMALYATRNSGQRKGVWKNSGVKGQIVHIQAKAERAFHAMFNQNERPDIDHLLDLINYAVFAIRLGDDVNGTWPWESDAD